VIREASTSFNSSGIIFISYRLFSAIILYASEKRYGSTGKLPVNLPVFHAKDDIQDDERQAVFSGGISDTDTLPVSVPHVQFSSSALYAGKTSDNINGEG
jgi:hypothetical protein